MHSTLPFFLSLHFLSIFAGVGISKPSDSAAPPRCSESESLHACASRLLDSTDAAECAWGAYLAGENRFTDLQPKLEIILKRMPAFYSDSSLFRVALDAAIKMDIRLPEKMLVSLPERYGAEQTILFARDPEKYSEEILAVLRSLHVCFQWQALGNLLLGIRAHGFPHVLMQELKKIPISISVTDPGPGAGRGGSTSWGIDELSYPPDFPPLGMYSLTDYETSSAVEVFPGPRVIYAKRIEHSPGYSIPITDLHRYKPPDWDPNIIRMKYLSVFLALPEDDITFSRQFSVTWTGPEQFIEDIDRHCSRIIEKYDRIVAILQEKDLIDPKEAEELICNIHIRIYDFRHDQSLPLPVINMKRVVVE